MPEKLTLKHVDDFEAERASAGITDETPSPKLLPSYTHGNPKLEMGAN